jgi:hypothetical protein
LQYFFKCGRKKTLKFFMAPGGGRGERERERERKREREREIKRERERKIERERFNSSCTGDFGWLGEARALFDAPPSTRN